MVALGWFTSAALGLISMFAGYTNHAKDGRRMETFEYALYFSLSKLAWSLALGWLIFACHYGYGGFINTLLSFRIYLPFNRISYCAYLVHPPLMVYISYMQQSVFHGSLIALVVNGTKYLSHVYSIFFSFLQFCFCQYFRFTWQSATSCLHSFWLSFSHCFSSFRSLQWKNMHLRRLKERTKYRLNKISLVFMLSIVNSIFFQKKPTRKLMHLNE